jgi:RNA polymerase sigma factor (sigma-70 family)
LFGFENGGCYWPETTMRDDAELLREYAEERSEDAFAELVRRHLGLVYNAALRQVGGDAHLAQDVAQSVFTDLARKAGVLGGRAVLVGWLYTSTRYAAVQVVRGEQRRRKREQEAQRMSEISSEGNGSLRADGEAGVSGAATEWERLRPVIDDALHALGERDREAVLLRFFEGRAFAEVGAKLAVSEDAARVRVNRALEKLRARLTRRGVTSTAVALAVALSGQAMAAVPAGLVVTVTGTALAGVSTAAVGTAGWMTFMGMTKLQIGLAGAIVAGGVAGFIAQGNVNTALKEERARVQMEGELLAKAHAEDGRKRAQIAAELSELRKDDVAFARLEVEAEVLKRDLAANLAARERLRKAASTGANDQAVFNVSEIDEVPKVKSRGVPPKYPKDLRAIGIEGNAVVRFVVDADGVVRNAEAMKSSHDAFAEVAVSAVKAWTFEAGKKANMPVNVQMVVPIVFALREEDGRANTWF